MQALIDGEFLKYEVVKEGPVLAVSDKGLDTIMQGKVIIKCVSIKIARIPEHPDVRKCCLPDETEIGKLPINEREYVVPNKEHLDEILCENEFGMFREGKMIILNS